MGLELTVDQRKGAFIYTVLRGSVTLATLSLHPTGENLFVHNTVSAWGRGLYREYRAMFETVQRDMKGKGFKLLITGSSCNEQQPKRERYWRMMGFSIFTDTEVDGHKLRAAVLDLEA